MKNAFDVVSKWGMRSGTLVLAILWGGLANDNNGAHALRSLFLCWVFVMWFIILIKFDEK